MRVEIWIPMFNPDLMDNPIGMDTEVRDDLRAVGVELGQITVLPTRKEQNARFGEIEWHRLQMEMPGTAEEVVNLLVDALSPATVRCGTVETSNVIVYAPAD